MLLESFIIFLAASFILVKSASYSVRSIVKIANYFRFSEFFISFVIAGMISIMPEFFIGINSALEGNPSIGLGTLLGSNIADLTLVIGIIALVGKRLKVDGKVIKNNVYFLILTSLPILLLVDGTLSRDDGFVLVFAFLVYMYGLVKREKIFGRKHNGSRVTLLKHFCVFAVSMAFLFAASHFVVESAISISTQLLVPSLVIGLFMVAIGTTLPELTFSLRAVLSKHKEAALGDVFGNVAIDSTLSIGVIAIINPVTTNFSVFATTALFMIFAALLVVTIMKNSRQITWDEGVVLLFLYGMFALIELKTLVF